ncbi:pyruvate dehydrogenase E1 component subunit alpha type I, mitochondrial-like [Glandiceps talaboti]
MFSDQGRTTGSSRGKGGSMHSQGPNFHAIASGVVGSQVPVGAGFAFSNKYRGSDDISLVILGDGAANQGQVFETYNMAKLWDLPLVFIIVNNQYGKSMPASRASASTDFYTRGDYIPGVWADGMDVVATRAATMFCADFCRSGKGPIILELSTYRLSGHSNFDPDTLYRSKEEREEMYRTRDPIMLLREQIHINGLANLHELKVIDSTISSEIDIAVGEAMLDPIPPSTELYTNVYHDTYKVKGCLPHVTHYCS